MELNRKIIALSAFLGVRDPHMLIAMNGDTYLEVDAERLGQVSVRVLTVLAVAVAGAASGGVALC